jgi:hypothetical protein
MLLVPRLIDGNQMFVDFVRCLACSCIEMKEASLKKATQRTLFTATGPSTRRGGMHLGLLRTGGNQGPGDTDLSE